MGFEEPLAADLPTRPPIPAAGRPGRGGHRYALYDQFRVASEADGFRLSLGSYSGDAGDSLAYSNDCKFSAWDRDNDQYAPGSCAQHYGGGWWFKSCTSAHLNVLGLSDKGTWEGVIWGRVTPPYSRFKESEMKLRPSAWTSDAGKL